MCFGHVTSARSAAFATRLEPAILVRAGVIILSLGRIMALVTRESLYCVMCDGQDEIIRSIQSSLLSLITAAERESLLANELDAQAAPDHNGMAGGMRRSSSDPRLSSSEMQQPANHLQTPTGGGWRHGGFSLQGTGGQVNGGVIFEFCGLVCATHGSSF